MTVILDYGIGNLRSVEKAIEALGFPVRVATEISGCERLIIPGVGAFGAHEGLGLLPGSVRYLPSGEGRKVPLIGWSEVEVEDEVLGRGLRDGDQFYFVHSLYTDAAEPSDVALTAHHGIAFPAAVRRENVWGMQFHPEKSGEAGLRLLRNFLES